MRNPANTPIAFGSSPEGYSGRKVGLEPSPHCPRLSSGALLEVTVHTDSTSFSSCEVEEAACSTYSERAGAGWAPEN